MRVFLFLFGMNSVVETPYSEFFKPVSIILIYVCILFLFHFISPFFIFSASLSFSFLSFFIRSSFTIPIYLEYLFLFHKNTWIGGRIKSKTQEDEVSGLDEVEENAVWSKEKLLRI